MITSAITFFLLLFLGGNYAIYKTIVYAFSISNSSTLLWLRIVLTVLMFSFPVIQIFIMRKFSTITQILYTGSAIWLGTLFWLCIATVIFWFIYGIVSLLAPQLVHQFNFIPQFSTSIALTILAQILLILAIGISAYGVFHSFRIKVKTATVTLANLPSAWQNKKIVLFSDSHFGNVRNANFSKRLVSSINKQKPDLVLVAGDFFDGTPLDTKKVTEPFQDISSKYGVYLAPGNHEEYGDETNFINSLESANVHVLNNQKEIVNGLQIIGINYSDTKKPEQERSVLEKLAIDKSQASILIKHEPANIDVAEEFNIRLQVSGHTHKGQMFPLSLLTKKIYKKFYYGLNTLNQTQVYTTSGVGTWGPPQRIGTDSEIVVIKLK